MGIFGLVTLGYNVQLTLNLFKAIRHGHGALQRPFVQTRGKWYQSSDKDVGDWEVRRPNSPLGFRALTSFLLVYSERDLLSQVFTEHNG